MTSGLVKSVPYYFIWVDRTKRQRKSLEGIEELAESIAAVGLIHFPVIRKSGELVTGERRWAAIGLLKWPEVQVQFIEDLPEHELQKVEYEENIRRMDIPWADTCLAVHGYHELMKAEDPKWTVDQTAEALRFSRRHIESQLAVGKELIAGNTRVVDAPLFSTALNVVRRETERRNASKLAELIPEEKKVDVPIINTDFLEWSKTYTGPKFNFIHCDFPYGIGADKHDQGAAPSFGGYHDTADIYWALLDALRAAMYNVVDDSAHLIFWFAMDYYHETKAVLEAMDWKVNQRPLIWVKDDGTSILPDPNRGPRWGYETAFFAHRGDRKIVQAVMNWKAHPATKSYHMSEKPVGMLEHFMRMTNDEYTRLLDPTAGSGNALIAGKRTGAGSVFGLERDKEFFEGACANWRENGGGTG